MVRFNEVAESVTNWSKMEVHVRIYYRRHADKLVGGRIHKCLKVLV